MTAIEIVMKRTEISEDDAAYYVKLAELRVRKFLELESTDELDEYLFGIADIATLMYQYDKSTKQANASLGYSNRSISEGSVSKSETAMTGSAIRETYEDAINDILRNLDGDVLGVRFI
jgi:hypothetical protein